MGARDSAPFPKGPRLGISALMCGIALLASIPSFAQSADDCRTLVNDSERLACYDNLHGPQLPAATQSDPLNPPSALEQREEQQQELQRNWFAITPYRPNYILPATYLDNADFSPYAGIGDTGEIKDVEAKYQLSVRTLLWPEMFGSKVDAWFAFTLQSYWQVYASDISAPFRETNYEPELFVSTPLKWDVLGWRLHRFNFGLVHQSNGRSEPLSRSWNRVFGQLTAEHGNAALYARAWWRIPEDDEDDDNPHIERYMGQGEFGGAYHWRDQTVALIIKNNFRSENKSGVQLDWSFPLAHHLKGYVQLYSGYGENLIDGPNYQNRVGLGLMLTDWL
ncbi:MAG TPA: phospholipase A [Steroidobacteraceae bacterium]|nr:phospholipase A [Steroidobacteraceae bacterium]